MNGFFKGGARGYSLPELIILLILLVVAGVFVVMNWSKLQPQSGSLAISPELVTVEAVNRGLAQYAEKARAEGKEAIHPPELDNVPVGAVASEQTPFFTQVLGKGVTADWKKTGVTRYEYIGAEAKPASSSDADAHSYSYDAATGKFGKGAGIVAKLTEDITPLRVN